MPGRRSRRPLHGGATPTTTGPTTTSSSRFATRARWARSRLPRSSRAMTSTSRSAISRGASRRGGAFTGEPGDEYDDEDEWAASHEGDPAWADQPASPPGEEDWSPTGTYR